MPTAPFARDTDMARLLDDGYDLVEQGGHLIIRRIPYVTAARTVDYGFLTYPITMAGDRVVSGTDHRIWFEGSAPCDEHGQPLRFASPEAHLIADGTQANWMLSSKPGPEGYPDEYTKVTAYARLISHPAQAIDPTVTATPGAAWQEIDIDSPFYYRDTATSRAGLAAINDRYCGHRIAIVGLGGTGSYILDQVAKTAVQSITLFDGDTFDNHNAFRSPGAPTLDTLRARPTKVDYLASIYTRMHRGVVAIPQFLDQDNLHLLDGTTFAFLASDQATGKGAVASWLVEHGVPFIDVGMGVEEIDGRLSGLLRTTTRLPERRDQAADSIPAATVVADDYSRNIQTCDLNALNATLAVIRWKRCLGIYADASSETLSTYSILTNEVINTDQR